MAKAMRRLRPAVAEQLFASTASLPSVRVTAVLTAQAMWSKTGLPQDIVLRKTIAYANKLSAQHLAKLKRVKLSPMAKAADANVPSMRRLLISAWKLSAESISMRELELGLTLGQTPWHVLEPAIQKMADILDG